MVFSMTGFVLAFSLFGASVGTIVWWIMRSKQSTTLKAIDKNISPEN